MTIAAPEPVVRSVTSVTVQVAVTTSSGGTGWWKR